MEEKRKIHVKRTPSFTSDAPADTCGERRKSKRKIKSFNGLDFYQVLMFHGVVALTEATEGSKPNCWSVDRERERGEGGRGCHQR